MTKKKLTARQRAHQDIRDMPKRAARVTGKKKSKKKPPGYVFGRPTDYRAEFCAGVIEHMSKGFSFESYGSVVHVGSDTLYDWVRDHSDFSRAKRIALEKSRLWWEKKANDNLRLSRGSSLAQAVMIFNMKNRFGWRDQPKDEADSKPPTTLTLKYNLEDEKK